MIVCHHVGARDGSVGGLLPARFSDDVRYVLFDADEACAGRSAHSNGGGAQWYPACLAREDGDAEFFVNADPYTSSLFPAAPRFASFATAHPKGFDYVLGTAASPKETRRIRTRSLDSLVVAGEVLPPDMIALDTQGSELAIIEGGLNSIRTNTLAIFTETALDEVYAGQPTFSALHDLMLREGFQLHSLALDSWAPRRAPIGLRAETLPLFADALYLRRLDRLPASPFAARKLAFFAAAFGHVELMLSALERSEPDRGTSYGSFLESLRDATKAMRSEFPRQWPEPRPHSPRIMRSIRKRLHWFTPRSLSPVEQVFSEWGFGAVALKLKERRLSDLRRVAG